VVDAPTGHVTLGAYAANGIEQKGIDTLQQCIKLCAAAGLGIPATVRSLSENVRTRSFHVVIVNNYIFYYKCTVHFTINVLYSLYCIVYQTIYIQYNIQYMYTNDNGKIT